MNLWNTMTLPGSELSFRSQARAGAASPSARTQQNREQFNFVVIVELRI